MIEFLTLFLFFLFFLPQISAKKCHELRCKTYDSPQVRFPFRLGDRQPPRCGYSSNLDLSCNQQEQTVLTLSSSSGDFTVESISYSDQSLWIKDQNKCIPKRLLDNDFSLVGSPFQFEHGLKNFTFFNCSTDAPLVLHTQPITCLSSDNYKVIALLTSSLSSLPSLCNMISTVMVPIVNSESDFGVRLTWGAPDCRSCESSGQVCGFKNTSSLELDCSRRAYVHQGNSRGETVSTATYVIGGGILVLLFLCVLAMCCFPHPPSDEHTTGGSGVTDHEQPPSALALNCVTTEAYPKTQLGDESLELPNPNDKTCAICLCDYQPKETIKTIPRCNHYFHVTCIDEWFRKNVTCPLCRTQSNNEGLGFS